MRLQTFSELVTYQYDRVTRVLAFQFTESNLIDFKRPGADTEWETHRVFCMPQPHPLIIISSKVLRVSSSDSSILHSPVGKNIPSLSASVSRGLRMAQISWGLRINQALNIVLDVCRALKKYTSPREHAHSTYYITGSVMH